MHTLFWGVAYYNLGCRSAHLDFFMLSPSSASRSLQTRLYPIGSRTEENTKNKAESQIFNRKRSSSDAQEAWPGPDADV